MDRWQILLGALLLLLAGRVSAQEPSPLAPVVAEVGRLRLTEQHATIAIPDGWTRLESEILERINQAAAAQSIPIRYFEALVPHNQPDGAPVYALLQWEARATSLLTRERAEAEIRSNLEASAVASAGGTRLRIDGPRFDWDKSRIDFETHQEIEGAVSITRTTGHLGATGILWVHCYPPVGNVSPGADDHARSLTLIADSVRFDPEYVYSESAAARRIPGTKGSVASWTIPGLLGAGLVVLLWWLWRRRT